MKNNLRTRIGALMGTLALMAVVTLPLLGTAQDATPQVETFDDWLLAEGEAIYQNVCIACHQPDGMGIAGIYLPLNNNPLVTNEDPTYLISTVLTGRGGMPAFASIYSDEEIAAITTWVRQGWDNEAGAVSPLEVAALREALFPPVQDNPRTQDEETEGDAQATPGATPAASPQATP